MATLVPLDFNDTITSNGSPTSTERCVKKAVKRCITHSGDTSSSEDEYQRNHDVGPRLSENGRAIKKRLLNAVSRRSPLKERNKFEGKSSVESISQRCDLQKKAQKAGAALQASPDSVAVCDSHFGIRIINPKVSSVVFNTYCSGVEKIRLSRLKPGMPPNGQWVTMGVVVDKSEYRKSANDHDYMIWRVGDLTDCQQQPVKLLLFGECLKEHWKVQIGTAIALTSPTFMDGDSQNKGFITLKVTKSIHLIEIGFCPDFGFCKASKKDGSTCRNVVNKSQSERCIFHIEKMARKLAANRGSFGTTTSNPPRSWEANKIGDFSKIFYAGAMVAPQRAAKPPTKLSSLGTNRTNRKAAANSQSMLLASKKEIAMKESIELKGILKNRAHMFGVKNLLKYYSARAGSSSNDNTINEPKAQRAQSFKEFINDQTKRDAIGNRQPILGRGQKDGVISLCSPQKNTAQATAADSALRKAINVIRRKGGIEKLDPNGLSASVRNRARGAVGNDQGKGSSAGGSAVIDSPEICTLSRNASKINEADGSSTNKRRFTDEELRAMINRKSTHENELNQDDLARETSYFNTMEQKEKVETYMTETLEVKNCDVITCKRCQYTWHRQSDYCLANGHAVVRHKADRRFFRCRTCAKRTICYELMPIKACTQCGENNFQRVGMRDERKVKQPNGELLIRGEERKFINS